MDVVTSEVADSRLAYGAVGHDGEVRRVYTQVGKGCGNVRFRAAVGYFKFVGGAYFFIVGGESLNKSSPIVINFI